MSLIFRLVYVYLLSFFREAITFEKATSQLSLRVLPNDLDINLHMNNGRFLTICDLNRVDLFIRSGLMKTMLKHKWHPIIAEHTMNYKRPLNLFDHYEVVLEVTHWDDKYFYMKHTFRKEGRILAEGTSKGAVRSKKSVIPPEEVIATVNRDKGL